MVLAPSLTCLPQWKMLWGIKRSARDWGQEGAEYRRGRTFRIQRLQRPMGKSLIRDSSLFVEMISNTSSHPNPPSKMFAGSRAAALCWVGQITQGALVLPVWHGWRVGVAGSFQSCCLLLLQDNLCQFLLHHCTGHSTCRCYMLMISS